MLGHLSEKTKKIIVAIVIGVVGAIGEAYLDLAEGVLRFLGIM